ncbi:MAG: hypothetical protein AAFX52_13005 [Pseudomonadota bacterium]
MTNKTTKAPKATKARTTITFDYERYAAHVADLDLTDDQAREVLSVLWQIMVQCVDLGFGIHPVQQTSQQSCGHDRKAGNSGAGQPQPVLSLDGSHDENGADQEAIDLTSLLIGEDSTKLN